MMTATATTLSQTPHPARRLDETWAVVGGGVLGLELARQLRAAGRNVTLFEAAPHTGGMADAWKLGDVVWDRHYHVVLMSDRRLRGLLDLLELTPDLCWTETKTGFYTDGKLYSMSNSVEFLRFPPLGLIDKLRLGATIFYASKVKNWRRLERIAVADWLESWSGRRTTEKIWLPLLRAKLGDNYRHASAAFIWAIIARMYAARKTGLKKEMFGYVRGGYGRILDRYESVLRLAGVTIRTGTPVAAVRRTAGRQAVETADGGKHLFDRVVVTAACPAVARMCPDLSADETARLRGIRYQGIVCVSVLSKQKLANFYVTNITDPDVPFTAIIEMTALVDPTAEFGGRHLIYLPKYVDPTDPLFDETDDAITGRFLAHLGKMYPHFRRDEVEAVRVSRVRNVLAISTIDYSANVPVMRTSVPGLFVVNTSQIANGTLNVNETLQLADRAMAELFAEVPA